MNIFIEIVIFFFVIDIMKNKSTQSLCDENNYVYKNND